MTVLRITSFSGEYAWLSNFHPAPVRWDGIEFQTVEHAYVAAKSDDPEFVKAVLACSTPGKAKRLGRSVELRDNWDEYKVAVMDNLVMQKFISHPSLRDKLLATGDSHLEEGNTWGDKFWGTVNGDGKNHLGEILMNTRTFCRFFLSDEESQQNWESSSWLG